MRSPEHRALLAWYAENRREFPWRRQRVSPWEILLAELLLARTGAARVSDVYQNWLRLLPSPRAVLDLREPPLEVLFAEHKLGLQNQRSQHLRSLARDLVNRHGGEVPLDPGALRELAGVGRYVANAVALFAGGQEVPVVDSNVARVYGRYFGLPPVQGDRDPPSIYWETAAASLPKGRAAEFSLALLDLAALVCKPVNPCCWACPLSKRCGLARAHATGLNSHRAGSQLRDSRGVDPYRATPHTSLPTEARKDSPSRQGT